MTFIVPFLMVNNILNKTKINSEYIFDTGVIITKTENYITLFPMVVAMFAFCLWFTCLFIIKYPIICEHFPQLCLQIQFYSYLVHILLLFCLLSGNETSTFFKFFVTRVTMLIITIFLTHINGCTIKIGATDFLTRVSKTVFILTPFIDTILCMILFYKHTKSNTKKSINTLSKKTIGTKIV